MSDSQIVNRRSRNPNLLHRYQLHIILAVVVFCSLTCLYFALGYAPARASLLYGPPANALSISDRIEYSARLLAYGDTLKSILFR